MERGWAAVLTADLRLLLLGKTEHVLYTAQGWQFTVQTVAETSLPIFLLLMFFTLIICPAAKQQSEQHSEWEDSSWRAGQGSDYISLHRDDVDRRPETTARHCHLSGCWDLSQTFGRLSKETPTCGRIMGLLFRSPQSLTRRTQKGVWCARQQPPGEVV